MRIAYFTAGDVGAGHLVRGLAIGRGLRRAGAGATFRMFGPALPFAVARRDDYQPLAIVADELRDPARAEKSAVADALAAFRPDLVLVDLFWAPLHHLLPSLGVPAWLLVRRCPDPWLVGPSSARFDRARFERVIAVEPRAHPLALEEVPPIVVCNRDECQAPGALRERLGMADGERLVVALHAGVPGELATLTTTGARVFDLHAADALFPLAEWLDDADEIRCGAGYNSFWEAHWLGRLARTRFHPFARRIDDQGWRLRLAGAPMRDNGADVLARQIAHAA